MRVASHLGMPVQKAQRSITSSEFVEWIVHLEYMETQHLTRRDYLIANIAKTLVQVNSKDPKKVQFAEFLLPLKQENDEDEKVVTEADRQASMQNSKNFWFAVAACPVPIEKKLGT